MGVGTLLGNLAWEPVPVNLAWEPLPENLAWEPLPGNPCLGISSWEPCLGTSSWKPCLGTSCWEPLLGNLYLGTLLGILLGNLLVDPFLGTLLGNLLLGTLAWEPFPGNLAWEFSWEWEPFPGNLLGNLAQCGFGCFDLLRDLYYGWRPQAYAVGEKYKKNWKHQPVAVNSEIFPPHCFIARESRRAPDSNPVCLLLLLTCFHHCNYLVLSQDRYQACSPWHWKIIMFTRDDQNCP